MKQQDSKCSSASKALRQLPPKQPATLARLAV